jgi:hypothetical protein
MANEELLTMQKEAILASFVLTLYRRGVSVLYKDSVRTAL